MLIFYNTCIRQIHCSYIGCHEWSQELINRLIDAYPNIECLHKVLPACIAII